MATTPDVIAGARAVERDADATFFARLSLAIALFIVFGFAQFAGRGMVDLARVPWTTHAHAVAMLAWLGLAVAQPRLVAAGAMAHHRTLGWASVALLGAVVVLGSTAGVNSLRNGTVPPFFSPPFFLALVHVGLASLVAMVAWAIALRRRTDWHRRLMIGALVMIMEPALGRLLPMPLIAPWGTWAALAFQLGALAFLWAHDRRTLGRVHPATIACALAVVVNHILIESLAYAPPVVRLAASIAAG
jgi:hypothetical protein